MFPHQYSLVYTTGQELGSTVLVSAIQSLQSSADTTGGEIPRGARPTAWVPGTSTTTLTAPRAEQGGVTDKIACQLPMFWGETTEKSPPWAGDAQSKTQTLCPSTLTALPGMGSCML